MQMELMVQSNSTALYISYHVISVIAFIYFLKTCFSDPGVFMRHKNYDDLKFQYEERKYQET